MLRHDVPIKITILNNYVDLIDKAENESIVFFNQTTLQKR